MAMVKFENDESLKIGGVKSLVSLAKHTGHFLYNE